MVRHCVRVRCWQRERSVLGRTTALIALEAPFFYWLAASTPTF